MICTGPQGQRRLWCQDKDYRLQPTKTPHYSLVLAPPEFGLSFVFGEYCLPPVFKGAQDILKKEEEGGEGEGSWCVPAVDDDQCSHHFEGLRVGREEDGGAAPSLTLASN